MARRALKALVEARQRQSPLTDAREAVTESLARCC